MALGNWFPIRRPVSTDYAKDSTLQGVTTSVMPRATETTLAGLRSDSSTLLNSLIALTQTLVNDVLPLAKDASITSLAGGKSLATIDTDLQNVLTALSNAQRADYINISGTWYLVKRKTYVSTAMNFATALSGVAVVPMVSGKTIRVVGGRVTTTGILSILNPLVIPLNFTLGSGVTLSTGPAGTLMMPRDPNGYGDSTLSGALTLSTTAAGVTSSLTQTVSAAIDYVEM